MDNKEIERKLKHSANKISMKGFDERWEAIKDQIGEQEETVEEKVLVTQVASACATAEGEYKERPHYRRKLVFVIIALFCVLTLAIGLPIILTQNKGMPYFNVSDLQGYIANEDEFFERLRESDISIIDLSHFAVESYILYVTPENDVIGGSIEFIDEEKEYFANIKFYDEYVQGIVQNTSDYSDFTINNIVIKYRTDIKGEEYKTVAITQYNKINYYIEILSVYDNVSEIFADLFDMV